MEFHLLKTSQRELYRLFQNKSELYSKSKPTNNNPRYSFNVSTGIFTIEDTNRIDNGEYFMDVHTAGGKEAGRTKCDLTIEGE